MAEPVALVSDDILSKIREEAYKTKDATMHHESLIETLKASVMNTEDLKTTFVKAAEEEATAKVDKEKRDLAKKEQDDAAAEIARKQHLESMGMFTQFTEAMKKQGSTLGDALKDDFKQITGGLNMIAEAPGIKSLVAIVTTMASSLGTLVLLAIKRNLAENSFLGRRIATTEDGLGIDFQKTLANFNPFGEMGFGDLFGKGAREKQQALAEGPQTKDGEADMRFKENQENKLSWFDEIKLDVADQFSESLNEVKGTLSQAGQDIIANSSFLQNNPITKGLKWLGNTLLQAATSLIKGAIKLAATVVKFTMATSAFIISKLAMIAAFLAVPILIGLAVAALIFGIAYLMNNFHKIKDDLMAKWEIIKEGFSIALEGLGIWKDKAVTFISNIFNKMWLGIRSLFVAVVEGIESAINYIISGVNALIPGERYDIDPIDLGAGKMRTELDADYAAFETEQATQAQDFADREKSLADRKANNTMERATTIVQNNASTVNEGTSQTTVVPSGTTPLDTNAGNMALAQ